MREINLFDTGMYIAFKDSLFGSNADLLNEADNYQAFDKNDTFRYVILDSLQMQLDSLLNKLFDLENGTVADTVYYNALDDETPSVPILDTLYALYEQIALTDSLIEIELANIKAALALRLNIADSLNNSIVAEHDFEEYELAINDILIQTALDTIALDSLQKASIERIAAMCPLEGGVAVYKARSLLYLYNDTIFFDDEALCALPSLRISQPEQSVILQDGMKVYPNPTNGQLFIEFPVASRYKILVYNSLGQRVFFMQTNEKRVNFDLGSFSFSSGLLLIEAFDEDTQKIYKQKVIYEK